MRVSNYSNKTIYMTPHITLHHITAFQNRVIIRQRREMANSIVHRNAGWKSNTPLDLLLYILVHISTILSDKGIAFLTNINYPGIRFTLRHHQFQSLCKNFGGALVLGDDLWASEIQLLLFSLVVRHLCPNSQTTQLQKQWQR
nr:hypothetical protein Iba_chr07bCG2950 [Ipomoea batatas]